MNEAVRWETEYSVNVPELDLQHRELFRIFDELKGAVRAGRGEAVLGPILDRVIAHACEHFATEEAVMEEHRYPDLLAHCHEHNLLTQQLTQFNLSRMAGRPGIPEALLDFLNTWLREHIVKSDKRYGDFVRARGVSSAEPH